jgi:Mn-dependent DtxR family transcriptional regulator
MAKKLTRRQNQFLSQFLDLYQENDKPIHYATLAKHLDIGKVTAYEMLRLLEKRGLVKSEFHLPSGDRGPGRSGAR